MVKNQAKKAAQQATDSSEMEEELSKPFYCGSCNCGFPKIEEYTDHCNEEEHNYHITRRIDQMVPGLGFCPACSCLIQTTKGWEHHSVSNKHSKCIESLNAIGIHGDYTKPLGCSEEGKLGLPIEATEIDQKISTSHGYGHGGRLARNVPLIGLNYISEVPFPNPDDERQGFKYNCGICENTFTFEHRGKHLSGSEHRSKYLKMHYEEWHQNLQSFQVRNRTRRLFRLMWYAHQIEQLELEQETEEAKKLRAKFVNEVTQKKEHNKWKENPRGGMRGGHGGEVYRGSGPQRGRGRPLMRGAGVGPYGRVRPRLPFSRHPQHRMRLPVSTMPIRGRTALTRPPFEEEFVGGYCGDMNQMSSLGKRPAVNLMSSQKKHKEDPYAMAGTTNQLDTVEGACDGILDPYEVEEPGDYSKALEAIEVLENFAMSKATENIKHRINSMKHAVLEETGLSIESIRSFGSSHGPRPRGRGLPSFAPRPMGYSGRMAGPSMDLLRGPRPNSSVSMSRGLPLHRGGIMVRPPLRHPLGHPRSTLPMRGLPRGRSMRPPMRH